MQKSHIFLLTVVFAFLPCASGIFNLNDGGFNPSFAFAAFENETAKTAAVPLPAKARKDRSNYRIKKVVIDPGHGGHDSGCSGSHSTEKHIALSVSQKMKAYMEAQHPDIQVVLTRNSDVFVPLHKRAAIANRLQADLFISVHCNSIRNASKIHGSETYVLGTHKLKENLAVAKRENMAILFEEDYEKQYDFDPQSDAGHITMSLYQNAYLEQSLLFAEKVESNIKTNTALRSRGVKQAGFLVLRETTMPSVLIETGYLTNSKDQNYLKSEAGQNRMAHSVAVAFTEYRKIMESGEGAQPYAAYTPAPVAPTVGSPYGRSSAPAESPVIIAPQRPASPPAAAPSPERPTAVVKSPPPAPARVVVPPDNTVQYRVQLAASRSELDMNGGRWRRISDYTVGIIREGGYYKYQAQGFYSFAQANAARRNLDALGFKGAWIVAYRGGRKIGLAEAKRATGE